MGLEVNAERALVNVFDVMTPGRIKLWPLPTIVPLGMSEAPAGRLATVAIRTPALASELMIEGHMFACAALMLLTCELEGGEPEWTVAEDPSLFTCIQPPVSKGMINAPEEFIHAPVTVGPELIGFSVVIARSLAYEATGGMPAGIGIDPEASGS